MALRHAERTPGIIIEVDDDRTPFGRWFGWLSLLWSAD